MHKYFSSETKNEKKNPKKQNRNLTDVLVPLWIQVGLIGQAAFHDVQTVVPAGLDGGHALAEGAVEHLGQCAHTRRGVAHLQGGRDEGEKKKLEISSVLELTSRTCSCAEW